MEVSALYHNTRPEGELLPQEKEVFDLLETLGIDYDLVSSEAADTMEKCDAVAAVLGVDICKNLFLCNRQQTLFYLLVMPPHKPFYTKDLSKQINSSRLSFAPEDKLYELLRCTPGSATALGLAFDTEKKVRFLVDRETFDAPYFSCHPCICTSSLKIAHDDFFGKFLSHIGRDYEIVEL